MKNYLHESKMNRSLAKNHVNIKDSKSLWIDELCVKSESQKKGIGK